MTEQNHMNLKFYSMIEDHVLFHNMQHVVQEEEESQVPYYL